LIVTPLKKKSPQRPQKRDFFPDRETRGGIVFEFHRAGDDQEKSMPLKISA
jgi:hypothetical protein